MPGMSTPTQMIVELFGGASSMARAIKRSHSTVQYWLIQGRIPEKNFGIVVAALRERAPAIVKAATASDGGADA